MLSSCLLAVLSLLGSESSTVADFSFVHLSDTRVEPRDAGEPEPETLRGEDTLRWIGADAKKTRIVAGVELPLPSFAVATGDLTEFGAPGETWKDVERLFAHLGLEWFPVAGSRDNTWTPVLAQIAARHPTPQVGVARASNPGREGFYSFDRFGCHFVVLDSATVHDPHASIDVDQLKWLREDLRIVPNRPLFLFLHHPIDSDEFGQPWQLEELLAALDGANVALVLHGGGHTPDHKQVRGLDCVQGGTTIATRERDDRGYNLVSVRGGRLRVEVRFLAQDREPRVLLEKVLVDTRQFAEANATPRLDHFELHQDGADYDWMPLVAHDEVTLLEHADGVRSQIPGSLVLRIDGEPVAAQWTAGDPITEARRNRCLNAGGRENRTWIARFDDRGLAPGPHLVSVELLASLRRTALRHFVVESPTVEVVSRTLDALGSQRAGVVVTHGGLRATAPGYFVRMDDPGVQYGGQNKVVTRVIGAPAYDLSAKPPLLVAGLASGAIVGLRSDGGFREAWTKPTGAPVYGAVLVDEGIAYVGDSAGRMHAIYARAGNELWSFATNGPSIEARPTIAGDLLVFGSWDGFVYALNKRDGSLVWKSAGQRSSTSGADARYVAPADAAPVVLGERIYVCDGGHELAWYSLTGERTRISRGGVVAIGASEDGAALYLRGTDGAVSKITPDGVLLWRAQVELGQVPAAPVERNGLVHVCSDRGVVAWIDARTGEVLGSYRATAGAWVLAPVAVDEDGTSWVAGLDGSVTGLRLRPR